LVTAVRTPQEEIADKKYSVNYAALWPYRLPTSFSTVQSVSWTMNNADSAQYFDNIIGYSFCSAGGS
jgi:hypothetical protein